MKSETTLEHAQKIRQTSKDWRKNDRKNNPEKYRLQYKKWYEKNREKILKNKNAYKRKRFAESKQIKIQRIFQSNFKRALKRKHHGFFKKHIGCGLNEFIDYIELKFLPGMHWDNYGKWHYDHIKPYRSFDLTKKEQRLACFHYTNVQPMWSQDNRIKGGKC